MYIKSDVDLDLTLVRSAQAFQWYFDGREYVGHAGGYEALIIPGDDGFGNCAARLTVRRPAYA